MRPTTRVFTVIAAAAVLPALSCESKPPTEPSRGTGNVAIEIVAPRALAPGALTPLRAVARRLDGSSIDVTSEVAWRSGSPDVLAIAADGTASAVRAGEALVTASLEPLSANREIIVVPEGTFRLVGRVLEEGSDTFAVSGARVQSLDDEAVWALTDSNGGYRLFGVPARARLRISRDGYHPRELTVELTDHRTENLSITRDRVSLDPTGTYEMTFQMSPTCRGSVPDELLERRYQATVQLRGRRDVEVTLHGATFAPQGNVVRGIASPGVLQLKFWYDFYFYYDGSASVVEVVDPQTYLVLWAVNDTFLVVSERGYGGTFNGGLLVFNDDPRRRSRERGSCYAPDNRLTLVR